MKPHSEMIEGTEAATRFTDALKTVLSGAEECRPESLLETQDLPRQKEKASNPQRLTGFSLSSILPFS